MGLKSKLKGVVRLANEKKIVPVQTIASEGKMLDGKTAVVLGATGGIGSAIAKSLYEGGARVVCCGTNEEKLRKLSASMDDSEKIRTQAFRVNEFDHLKENVEKVNSIFGDVDIVVNSAGVHTENVDFKTMTPTEFDRVMEINLKAPYFVFQAFAEHMLKNNRGGTSYLLVHLVDQSQHGLHMAFPSGGSMA